MRIDLDPLPEMENARRDPQDRARYFAPVRPGGREYERTVLIGYANGQPRPCQVMAEAEPDASLKKFLLDAEKRYDGLYDRVTTLLDIYFKDPNGKMGIRHFRFHARNGEVAVFCKRAISARW